MAEEDLEHYSSDDGNDTNAQRTELETMSIKYKSLANQAFYLN